MRDSIGLLKRLAVYTANYSARTVSLSLLSGKSACSVALFEAAALLDCDEVEDAAVKILQQALKTESENISFDGGWAGVGSALVYLINHEYIDPDSLCYFTAKRLKIRSELSQTIAGRKDVSGIYSMLNWLTDIYFLDAAKDEEVLIGSLINTTLRQLIDEFSVDSWLHKPLCKPVSIDRFIFLLRILDKINKKEQAFLYDTLLCEQLCDRYAFLYLGGYLANYYSLGHYLGRIHADKGEWNSISGQNRDIALQGTPVKLLSLQKQRELVYLVNKDCVTGRFPEMLTDNLYDAAECIGLQPMVYSGDSVIKHIPGLLLFVAYDLIRQKREDTARFDLLFI